MKNPQNPIEIKHLSSRQWIENPEVKASEVELVVFYEKSLSKLQKAMKLDLDLVEKFKIDDHEFACTQTLASGFKRIQVWIMIKSGLPVFFLHEVLAKSVGSRLAKSGGSEFKFALDVSDLKKPDQETVLYGIGNLFGLSAWEPRKFGKKSKASAKAKKAGKSAIRFFMITDLTPKQTQEILEHAALQSESTNLVRTLADMPGNYLDPDLYVQKLKDFAQEWKCDFKFYNRKALKARGANAFLAVAAAEPDSNCGIVELVYKPKGRVKGRVALVGKGLCFDTGGYDIKVGGSMLSMHRDMTGSAVVAAIFKLLRQSKVDLEVRAYLAIAENLISPLAYRPNDVVIASNGVSIEVVDTDAEGRMVLSDTLVMASESKPDLLLDFATLTGACVRSIDTRRSGIFSTDSKLLNLGVEVGEETGERTWGFPVGQDYWREIESEIADVRQCASGRNSDHIYAATFLSTFVGEGIDWIHMDLSADSNKGGLGLIGTETTGFGVRWAERLIERYFKL